MEIDFNKEFKTLEGETILQSEDNDKSLSLKTVAVTALLTPDQKQDKTSGEEKAERYMLAQEISRANGTPVDVKTEDIVLLKKLIGELYLPLIVGQAYQLLENKD